MSIKNILGQSSFWMVNKKIAEGYGLKGALLLSVLVDGRDICGVDKEGWFYQTALTLEEITGIKDDTQRKIFKELEGAGFIKTKLQGIPRKRYIKVMDDEILGYLLRKNSDSSIRKNRELKPEKIGINKEYSNKDCNNRDHKLNLGNNNLNSHQFSVTQDENFETNKESLQANACHTPEESFFEKAYEPKTDEPFQETGQSETRSYDEGFEAGYQKAMNLLPKGSSEPVNTPPFAARPPRGWDLEISPEEAVEFYRNTVSAKLGNKYRLEASREVIASIWGIIRKLREEGATNSVEALKRYAERAALYYFEMGESMSKRGINAGGVFANVCRPSVHLSKFAEIMNASEYKGYGGKPDGACVTDEYIQDEIDRMNAQQKRDQEQRENN